MINSSQHRREREQVKTKDIYLVAMLGLRVKMDCSIPINSIPRCSAIAEGWTVEREQKETRETRLREWHLLTYSGASQQLGQQTRQ